MNALPLGISDKGHGDIRALIRNLGEHRCEPVLKYIYEPEAGSPSLKPLVAAKPARRA